jgi:hypothetical protein
MVSKYGVVTGMHKSGPHYPAASSDQLSASVAIDAPASVSGEARFKASAQGSYTLSEDLQMLIRSGQAGLRQGWYEWDGYPVGVMGGHPMSQTVTCWFWRDAVPPKDESDLVPGLWVAYVMAVLMPDGSFQWARAEAHCVVQSLPGPPDPEEEKRRRLERHPFIMPQSLPRPPGPEDEKHRRQERSPFMLPPRGQP